MRMQHWSKWVMALLVNAACVATAHAQDYPVDVTDQSGVNQPQAGIGTVDTTQMGTPMGAGQFTGYSNGYGSDPVQPWPEVSPFDNSFDQTYYDEGLWYRRTNRRQTEHFFGLDYFNATPKRPKSGQQEGIIGIPSQNDHTAYAPLGRRFVGVPEDISSKQAIYAPHYSSDLGSAESRPGVIGRYGAIFADDSRFEVTGFYAAKLTGDSRQVFQAPFGTIDRSFDVTASVGEDSGDFITANGNFIDLFPDSGRLVFSDSFNMTFESNSWGAQANFLTTPVGGSESLGQLSAIFGVTYLAISERFGIEATDSGLTAPIVGNIGRAFIVDPYTMHLSSKLQSNLVGPQAGLRWSTGGDFLKLTAEVKGAITANFESRHLAVDNYGIRTNIDALPVRAGDLNYARLQERSTTWAPLLETSIMTDWAIMQALPVIKKLPGFRESKFRFGYTYTQAWRIAGAMQSVQYDSPLPRIQTKRDNWHIGGFVAGFTWTR